MTDRQVWAIIVLVISCTGLICNRIIDAVGAIDRLTAAITESFRIPKEFETESRDAANNAAQNATPNRHGCKGGK